MEETLKFTRTDLIAAFTRWHADCAKNPDGTLAGTTPDNPTLQADTLISHLKGT